MKKKMPLFKLIAICALGCSQTLGTMINVQAEDSVIAGEQAYDEIGDGFESSEKDSEKSSELELSTIELNDPLQNDSSSDYQTIDEKNNSNSQSEDSLPSSNEELILDLPSEPSETPNENSESDQDEQTNHSNISGSEITLDDQNDSSQSGSENFQDTKIPQNSEDGSADSKTDLDNSDYSDSKHKDTSEEKEFTDDEKSPDSGEVLEFDEDSNSDTESEENSAVELEADEYSEESSPAFFSGLKNGHSTTMKNGVAADNLSYNNYSIWSNPVGSYLYQNSNGTYTRVQAVNASSPYVLIESYSSSFTKTGSRKISNSLPLFGGFYHGKNKNYLVFGQRNPGESNSLAVLRIIQYSHSWNKEKTLDISNVNTVDPFSMGTCRFTETDQALYVYTCHSMYNTGDGLNHQSNMIFEIDKSTFKVKQSSSDCMTIDLTGYVSHSLNQFILQDGSSLYRIDQGDLYPRSLTVSKSSIGGNIRNVNYRLVYPIADTSQHYTYTGVSIGGAELSDNNILIAGNSIDMKKKDNQRNIMVSVTDKNLKSSKTVWLTNYTASDNIEVLTPHMVKLTSDRFLILWEEQQDYIFVTNAAVIDGSGNLLTSVYNFDIRLSDCKPIYCQDGLVRWYTSDYSKTTVYALQPMQLSKNAQFISNVLKPVNLKSAKLTVNGAALTWDKMSRASGYSIYRKTGEYGYYMLVDNVSASTTSYIDKTISAGYKYEYKVRAYKKLDDETRLGRLSSAKTVVFQNSPSLSVSPKSGVTMSLSWNKANKAGGYEIWYSSNGSSYSKVKALGAAQTSTSHSNLSAGKLYYYKLITLDSKGNRVSVSSAKKAATLAPAKPSSISQNADGITLKWSKASGADSYNIYRSSSKNGSYKYVCSAVGASTTSWTDRSVEAGRTYYYKVRPCKRINGTVYYANWASPAGLTMKSSVKSVKATPKSGVTMTISWAKTANARSYDIYVSTNGKSFKKVKNVAASQTSTSHTGLKAGTLYYYKVAAFNSKNKVIALSDAKKAVTLAPASIQSISQNSNGVKIQWSKASGADRYNIYRSTSKNGTYEYLQSNVGANNCSFTDKTAKKGKTYYYKIRPYKRVNGTVYYAAWAGAKGLKVQ